jgi:hypothetical protein
MHPIKTVLAAACGGMSPGHALQYPTCRTGCSSSVLDPCLIFGGLVLFSTYPPAKKITTTTLARTCWDALYATSQDCMAAATSQLLLLLLVTQTQTIPEVFQRTCAATFAAKTHSTRSCFTTTGACPAPRGRQSQSQQQGRASAHSPWVQGFSSQWRLLQGLFQCSRYVFYSWIVRVCVVCACILTHQGVLHPSSIVIWDMAHALVLRCNKNNYD